MANCVKCGNQLDDACRFCPSCGAEQPAQSQTGEGVSTPVQNNYQYTSQGTGNAAQSTPKRSGQLSVMHLVWACINFALCCTPLGIAGILLTVLAKDAPTPEEEKKKLSYALICNIIGTAGGLIIVVLYFIGTLASVLLA